MNVSPLELKIELRCCLECFDVNLIIIIVKITQGNSRRGRDFYYKTKRKLSKLDCNFLSAMSQP
jgi:hypothetical protein